MKKIIYVFCAQFIIFFWAYPAYADQNIIKLVSGIVTKIDGSQVVFRSGNGALYSAESGSAILTKKYGSSMLMEEILPGDKIETKGQIWSDNSISSYSLRDLSLYTHTGTFTGKVVDINPVEKSFTLQSRQFGKQNITTNDLTAFKKNKLASIFSQIELGISELVKGSWERDYGEVLASSINGTTRLVDIEITGSISNKNEGSLTVVADNAIYGVSINNAKLLSKNNKPLNIEAFSLGQIVRVSGRHISEGVAITAISVKNLSVSK